MKVLDIMRVGPVIPVIVIEKLSDAVPLARHWWRAACESWR